MEKIISLFQRNYDGDRLVRDELVPGAEWVQRGEGTATVKWDGTCCMIRDRKLFKRYDVKKGRKPPENFEAAQDPDPVTGHWPGWVPVGNGPEDRWHREAFERGEDQAGRAFRDGTYELIGPKVQGNPYGREYHALARHGDDRLDWLQTAQFAALRSIFEHSPSIEGIVWHHSDGRMVKIKRRDFGLPWPVKGGS